jgi:hypothetical protein
MANSYTDLLKYRMPALGDVGWDDEVNDNTMINEFILGAVLRSNVVISGLAVTDAGSLDVDVAAGSVVVGGSTYSVTADTLTLTSGVKNWIYVDGTGALQSSATMPTGNYVALAMADCGTSWIDRIADARNFAEGALTIGVDYTPDYYDPDTGQTGAINQHLAGIDARLAIMAGFKNKLINGDFSVWQRGTSQTASDYGSADRWRCANGGGTTKTASQQPFTIGQSDVPGNPKYFMRHVVTTGSGASDYCLLQHRLENVAALAGLTVTVSFWAKADATRSVAVEFIQNFGTGGSPSTRVDSIGVEKISLSTSWQRFSFTVDLPSISGKTLGTDGNDYLGVNVWFDAGSDYNAQTDSLGNQSGTFEISQAQLEKGAIATEFENRPNFIEKLLCYPFCWVGAGTGNGYGHFYASSGDVQMYACGGMFPVQMRSMPTMTYITTPSYSNCSSPALFGYPDSFMERVTVTSTGKFRATGGVYCASAEL